MTTQPAPSTCKRPYQELNPIVQIMISTQKVKVKLTNQIMRENPSLLCIEMGVLKHPSLNLSGSLVREKAQNPLQFICMTKLSELRNCMTSFILIHVNVIMDRTLLLLVP